MPIYEYTCEKCEKCFEKLVFAGDDDPVVCPDCGTKKVTKLMSCTGPVGEGIGGACSSGSGSRFS